MHKMKQQQWIRGDRSHRNRRLQFGDETQSPIKENKIQKLSHVSDCLKRGARGLIQNYVRNIPTLTRLTSNDCMKKSYHRRPPRTRKEPTQSRCRARRLPRLRRRSSRQSSTRGCPRSQSHRTLHRQGCSKRGRRRPPHLQCRYCRSSSPSSASSASSASASSASASSASASSGQKPSLQGYKRSNVWEARTMEEDVTACVSRPVIK